MMTMSSVLESALTVSPTLMPTDTIVPLIGLVSCPSARDCSAPTTLASAVSIAASSEAIWVALSEAAPLIELPLPLVLPPPPVMADVPEDPVDPDDVVLLPVPPEPDEDSAAVSALASVVSSDATVCWSLATDC